jgi:hypothetical protein
MSMKSVSFTLLALLLFCITSRAQIEKAGLLAQSPDGKTVKLVWFLKSVPGSTPGFDIKRKDGLGDWHVLNTGALLCGISAKKDLTQFESDNIEVTRIREKLKDLIKSGQLPELDYNTFIAKWKNNDKAIKDILNLAAGDFDISVACGFGFVDHTATQKTEYQYGLFVHGTDILLDKVTWNYGEIPDLNLVQDITSRSLPGKKGIHLIWTVDALKFKTAYVAGFNVYKRGIRLNDGPISVPVAGAKAEFSWNDADANSSVSDQYSISAESLFGIEGIIRSYTYDPADHPTEYKKAIVTEISSLGFYFKDGISIAWTFPKDYERFIKGFYVEKDNMPAGYKRVSDLLAPGLRSYIDKTGSPVSSPVRIRVIAVYNDKTIGTGVERIYSYFPMLEPPMPQNTQAVASFRNGQATVNISWDPPMNGDSATHHYKVYRIGKVNVAPEMLAEKLPLKSVAFQYPVPAGPIAVYEFYVVAVGRSGTESLPGDTVSVTAPSTELPAPVISTTTVTDSGRVNIKWQFPEIGDLSGFRLFNDALLLADEKVLKATSRDFTTVSMPKGSLINLTIRAISDKGVLSNPSAPASVTIPAIK